MSVSSAQSSGPLAGLRVLELAGLGPAPFCGMLLADLGAEVVRVDRIAGGNAAVEFEPRFDVLGRGRRFLRLDLKQTEGVEAMLRLVERSDALIEGFRPGVLERLGLAPDVLHVRNRRLVIGRMTGWGQEGPLAQTPGHDINYVALAGALHNIGAANGPPVPPLNLVGDFGGGGLLLAFGLMCALFEARQSGRGQVVDAAMVDGSATLLAGVYAMLAQGVFEEGRGTSILSGGAPFYAPFACADGQYITIGALEPPFYQELVERLDLDRELFGERHDPSRWPAQRAALEAVFERHDREEWCERLQYSNVCFAPVLSMREAPEHPHNRARGTFVERSGVTQPAPAPRFSRTPARLPRPAVAPGSDTTAVLRDWGFSDAEVQQLLDRGAAAGI
jgi:alpha-methylacyl-CoA racemase